MTITERTIMEAILLSSTGQTRAAVEHLQQSAEPIGDSVLAILDAKTEEELALSQAQCIHSIISAIFSSVDNAISLMEKHGFVVGDFDSFKRELVTSTNNSITIHIKALRPDKVLR